MSYGRKNAVIAAAIWTFVLAGLLVTVFLPGPVRFAAPDYGPWRLLSAFFILPGLVTNAWLGWRAKHGKDRGDMDERDDAIARRASQATLVVTVVMVYLLSIILFEAYYETGAVPTGWLWLLAYGTAAVVSLVHALASLFFDVTGLGDA